MLSRSGHYVCVDIFTYYCWVYWHLRRKVSRWLQWICVLLNRPFLSNCLLLNFTHNFLYFARQFAHRRRLLHLNRSFRKHNSVIRSKEIHNCAIPRVFRSHNSLARLHLTLGWTSLVRNWKYQWHQAIFLQCSLLLSVYSSELWLNLIYLALIWLVFTIITRLEITVALFECHLDRVNLLQLSLQIAWLILI